MFQCSKLLLLCNRVVPITSNCNIFTFKALLARSKKSHSKNKRIESNFDDENNKLKEEFSNYDENGEQGFDSFDFTKIHLAHKEYYREKRKLQDRIEKKIIAKKFFSPGSQPPMLTYNERECIKHLNKQDPVQWNVQALSKSFPATPEIIIKVLRSHWKPSPEKIKKIDKNVQKNWELLKAGKLEASPNYIAHLETFTNRKEILLEQIKNSKFFLPEIKKKKIWNNNEMSKILSHYEKKIKTIQNRKVDNLLVESNNEIKGLLANNSEDEKNVVFHKQLNEEQGKLNVYKQESSTIQEIFSNFSKSETLDNLKSNIIQQNTNAKAELSKIQNEFFKNNIDTSNVTLLNKKSKNNNSYKDYEQKLPRQLFTKESSISVMDESSNNYFLQNEEEIIDKLLQQNKFHNFKKLDDDTQIFTRENFNEVSCNTQVYTETNVNNSLEEKSEEKKLSKKIASKMKFIEFIKKSPESKEKDEIIFEKEKNDLINTAFWNEKNISEKQQIKKEQIPLKQLEDIKKVTKADIYSTDVFPLKIKIPKSQKGSGLIFKLNDCYYDDDGEFLYRVPGMTK